jgi:hypothetical protein
VVVPITLHDLQGNVAGFNEREEGPKCKPGIG